jgi:DNA invertase Pin-like site-specific DNA recombinase
VVWGIPVSGYTRALWRLKPELAPAELQALGVDLMVLDQATDSTTPSGRLLFHVLASIAEFERDLIRDRVVAGMRRARAQGMRIGRPRTLIDVPRALAWLGKGQSLRQAAKTLGVAASTLASATARKPPHLVT